MKKALAATQKDFESASYRTPEYLAWHRLFKREFTKFLAGKGATNIQIGKPNHFDMSGFFTLCNQPWYFRIEDIRWSKDSMLIRTARDYKDFTGGRNQSILLQSEESFTDDFNGACLLDILTDMENERRIRLIGKTSPLSPAESEELATLQEKAGRIRAVLQQ